MNIQIFRNQNSILNYNLNVSKISVYYTLIKIVLVFIVLIIEGV